MFSDCMSFLFVCNRGLSMFPQLFLHLFTTPCLYGHISLSVSLSLFSLPSCLIHFLPQQLPGLILSGSTSTALGFTAGPLFIRCFLLPLQLRSSWVWLNICPKVLLVEMRITPQQRFGRGGAYECEADLSYCRCLNRAPEVAGRHAGRLDVSGLAIHWSGQNCFKADT